MAIIGEVCTRPARERSSSPPESSFNEKHASMRKNAWFRPISRRPPREMRNTGIEIYRGVIGVGRT